MAIPAGWANLGFTSGRRTYAGNRAVGGVPNSGHLDGTDADFTASKAVLRARFGPGVRILDEGDHRHVSGLSGVPYYGNRGIMGLVNGVDTSAPKGQPKMRPNPIQRALTPLTDEPFLGMAGVDAPTQMTLAHPLPQKAPGAFGKGGKGWAILGILGDALSAYGGQKGVYAPMLADQMAAERDDTRFRERLAMESAARKEAILAKANEPTELMQRVNDLNTMRPGLGNTYAENYANNGGGSMVQFVDPATGQRMMIPKPQLPTAPVGTLTPL